MGGAIEHWLGFQDKIGRAFMMNEDALKYPLSDYLVNGGGLHINAIELEYPHPDFPNRLIDTVITDNIDIGRKDGESLVNAYELKLARTNTRYDPEKKRIFNDLIRMYMANKHSTSKCYFIITGKSIHFERDFRNHKVNGVDFYRKWFKFVKGDEATFQVNTETDTIYKDIYDSFIEKYKKRFQGTGTLTLPTKITTTCEFITAYKSQLVPYISGIWSVK